MTARPYPRTLAGALVLVLLLAALVATIARAAGPPTVTTGAASAITASSATVSGTVNPAGSATTYVVDYGTTTAYGTSTSAQNAGSGSSDVAVSVDLTGLSASTTYHYRVRATNGDGTTAGEDRTFTTTAVTITAPDATTGAAGSITATSAKLSASVNPQGTSTSVVFDVGTTTAYGTTTAAVDAGSGSAAKTVSATVTGLAPKTTYHYRVRASNGGGETVGADKTFTTTAVSAPTVTTQAPSAITATSATYNATVDPHGAATTAYVEYGPTNKFGTRTAAISVGAGDGPVPVAITVGGLTPETKYSLRIVATNAAGSKNGATKTITTAKVSPLVTFTATPSPLTWGSSAKLVGSVTGTGPAGARVTLVGTVFPFTSPFTRVGDLLTGKGGTFTFTVSPRVTTRYRVRAVVGAQTPESRTVRLSVKPRVGITFRRRSGGRVRFSGIVAPRGGGVVSLRRITSTGTVVTVKRSRTIAAGTRSRYAITIRAPHRTSRYLVRVVPTSRALVHGQSRVVAVAGR